ncbi:MAG: hypothetical protein ACRD5H_01075 [Nitrososphaerales archaeon]
MWTIDDSLNVSSITDNGVGDFTINWATTWASANYAVVPTLISIAGNAALNPHESTATVKSTTLVRIAIVDIFGTLTDPGTGIQVIAVGDR